MAIPPPAPPPTTGTGPSAPLVDASWAGANGGAGVLQPTTGDAQQLPSQHMPGSASGARPAAYTTAAQAVYPTLTGVGAGRLPVAERPASFSSDAPADFASWHSAYQVEWLKNQTTPFVPNTYSISDDAGNLIAFYALTDDDRPVNLMTMTKAEYGKLSAADRSVAAGTIGGYLQIIGRLEALGLTTDFSTVSSALSNLQTAIDDSGLPEADKAVFFAQFQLLRGGDPRSTAAVADADMMANITGAIATDVYAERIAALGERLDRAIRFHATPDPFPVHTEARVVKQPPFFVIGPEPTTELLTTVGTASLIYNGNSTDGGATIRGGYAEFMRAERAILASQTMRAVQAGLPYSDPRLDVANLINFFQLRYEDEARAIADAGTEEIRQLNKLLQDYALMQQMVQKQIGFYDPSKQEEKRRFMNVGSYTDGFTRDGNFIETEFAQVDNVRGVQYALFNTTTGGRIVGTYSSDLIAVMRDRNMPRFHFSLILEGSSSFSDLAKKAAAIGQGDRTPVWTGNELDDRQAAALSMFMGDSQIDRAANNRTHPLETLYGANRPLIDILDRRLGVGEDSLALKSKNEWDSFATQLSETVTILNQQNQIRQNEIQNAEKQANRHFELGNNALRKMNDILMSIGRI